MSLPEGKNTNWIKNLARAEQKLETEGQISLHSSTPSTKELTEHTQEFMHQIRSAFIAQARLFNHIKGFLGSLRIHGIADTHADFMLFRHGHKLIFSVKEPGLISIQIKLHHQNHPQSQPAPTTEPADFIKGEWGPFNELKWTYNNQRINIDFLVRYYMTMFIKNSVK